MLDAERTVWVLIPYVDLKLCGTAATVVCLLPQLSLTVFFRL
jgi:hypothetical protein